MKQLPGPKSGIIRVQMDEDELKRMLQPILQEVNSLRARVADLETLFAVQRANMGMVVDNLLSLTEIVEVLAADLEARQDDGK